MDRRYSGLLVGGIILIAMLTSCYRTSNYKGDGYLVDNGSFEANERYVLDLGLIASNKQETITYQMANLPTVEFTVGMLVSLNPKDRIVVESVIKEHSIKPEVLIELLGPDGDAVFRDQSSLDTWTWNYRATDRYTAFVYRQKTRPPSTYFTPVKNGRYELRVKFAPQEKSALKYTARIILKSGGWK